MFHAALHTGVFIIFLSHLWQLPQIGVAQLIVPPIACPNYFEYQSNGNGYFGRITLPNVPMGTSTLQVQLSQRGSGPTNYYGELSLYQDQETTINNLQRGRPISYRVDFPIPNILPKLTRIAINGVDICLASEFPPPSITFDLHHKLQTTTIRGTSPFNSNFDGDTIIPVNRNTFPSQNFNQFSEKPQFTNLNTLQNPFLNNVRQTPQPSSTVPTIQLPLQPQCGIEGNTVTPFIHGGIELARGQFPWLAAVYRKQSSGLRFLCGGSLVSTNTVITAAHCFKLKMLNASQVVVYLGRHNLENYGEEGVAARDIRNLLIHPDYSDKLLPDADIAILQMQTSVSFSEYIRPICLWSETSGNVMNAGQTAFVAGWGADENGREVTALPKMVDVAIASDNDCLRSSEVYSKLTTPRTLCAGNRDGTGPCMGDSGGGLMISRNGLWTLRGIVSAGLTTRGRCDLSQYVIYTDLAKHIAWVRNNIS